MQYLLFLLLTINYAIANPLYNKSFLQNLSKDKDYDIQIGTGMFIDDQTILSSFHIINDCSHIIIENSVIQPQKATLFYSDDQLDIALLKTALQNSVVKKLYFAKSRKLPDANNPIYIALFPSLESSDYVLVKTDLIKVDDHSIYFSGDFKAGNSGSPIFDRNMNLIGILIAKIEIFNNQKELINTNNQATHVSAFKKLIKDCDIESNNQKTRLNHLQDENYLASNLVKIYCLKY